MTYMPFYCLYVFLKVIHYMICPNKMLFPYVCDILNHWSNNCEHCWRIHISLDNIVLSHDEASGRIVYIYIVSISQLDP